MKLRDTGKNWHRLGKQNPFFAILNYKNMKGGGWKQRTFFKTGQDEIAHVMRYVKSHGLLLSHVRALDFGCGVGRLTQPLAEHFHEVHGVDIAPSMIQRAKQYNSHNGRCFYHLNRKDNLRLFPDGYFDFIYSNITLQHIEPRYSKKYLSEFSRTLKPGGALLFQLPSELAHRPSDPSRSFRSMITSALPYLLITLARRFKHHFKPQIEMYGIFKDEVMAFLAAHHFRVIDTLPDTHAGHAWISFRYLAIKE